MDCLFLKMLIKKIKTLSKKYAPEYIQVRRHLHANPELSYQEFETSKFVQHKLNEFGIPFRIKATTGVVGLIKGKNPDKKIVALRADMDALPIREENNVEYRSKRDGIMHACGHDVHMASLLGTAEIIAVRNALRETVRELGAEEFHTRTGYDFEVGKTMLAKLNDLLSG